jgi:hypothetical protein
MTEGVPTSTNVALQHSRDKGYRGPEEPAALDAAVRGWQPAQIMEGQASADQPRRLSAPLLLAILALPLLFVWLLLRLGYSSDLRTGAFLYALLFPALQLAALLLTGRGG